MFLLTRAEHNCHMVWGLVAILAVSMWPVLHNPVPWAITWVETRSRAKQTSGESTAEAEPWRPGRSGRAVEAGM